MKFPGFRWTTAALAVALLAAGCSTAATATPVAAPPERADISVDVFPTIDFGFPLSVVPAQLQRVVDTMVEFGMLPAKDISFKITKMTG